MAHHQTVTTASDALVIGPWEHRNGAGEGAALGAARGLETLLAQKPTSTCYADSE